MPGRTSGVCGIMPIRPRDLRASTTPSSKKVRFLEMWLPPKGGGSLR